MSALGQPIQTPAIPLSSRLQSFCVLTPLPPCDTEVAQPKQEVGALLIQNELTLLR